MSIALESYYILDDYAIATESTENITSMIIGFLVQMVKKLSQILMAHWPKLLAVLASLIIPAAVHHAMSKCADGVVNEIGEKFTSVGNHVIGVIQDFATGLRDISVANIHLAKMTEDCQILNDLNNKVIEHGNNWQSTGIRPYVTKEAYNKCKTAYEKTKEILEEANARLQRAINFDWESKGNHPALVGEVRKYFSEVQSAFSRVLSNTNTIMSNITKVFAQRRR